MGCQKVSRYLHHGLLTSMVLNSSEMLWFYDDSTMQREQKRTKIVEQTHEAIFLAGVGEEREMEKLSSLAVFEHMSPIMSFCNFFPKQMDPEE